MFNRIGIVSHRFDNDARLLTLQRDSGRERERQKKLGIIRRSMYAIGKKLPTVTAKRGRDPSERQPSTQKTSCQVRTSVRVNRLRNSI